MSNNKSMNFPFPFKSPTQTRQSPLRIADILLADEDDDPVHLPMSGSAVKRRNSDCSSLIRRLCRFRRSVLKSKSKIKREEDRSELGDFTVHARPSEEESNRRNLVSGSSHSVEQRRGKEETCFNVGVGFVLLSLVAASKNELDKMMELRANMEALLRTLSEELHSKKDSFPREFEPNNNDVNDIVYPESTTDVPQGSDVLPESSPITTSYDELKQDDTMDILEGIDQLEAELEAEIERMQFQLDEERLYSQHSESEGTLSWQREDVDIVSASYSVSFGGEVIDPQEATEELHRGVPPRELERKLHELLETRQQEQIRELEAGLECINQKLYEKELEVSWWKDTAMLIAQHVPHSSRLATEGEHQLNKQPVKARSSTA
ncbi:hypothetical protein K2173_023164 [Erythroxylum novogranatense]|uniref:Protein POLAR LOCALIZATION DURING ASYMMETRIC DIVISION AND REDISTRIBUTION-like n=1 Tax=Erythroxylum novogranatense TaxID=1862640 RepID=A0AAV8UB55_9ROSI|nr:hypothetical protein K2173_023164 [Erythroxylum novogranatense]